MCFVHSKPSLPQEHASPIGKRIVVRASGSASIQAFAPAVFSAYSARLSFANSAVESFAVKRFKPRTSQRTAAESAEPKSLLCLTLHKRPKTIVVRASGGASNVRTNVAGTLYILCLLFSGNPQIKSQVRYFTTTCPKVPDGTAQDVRVSAIHCLDTSCTDGK